VQHKCQLILKAVNALLHVRHRHFNTSLPERQHAYFFSGPHLAHDRTVSNVKHFTKMSSLLAVHCLSQGDAGSHYLCAVIYCVCLLKFSNIPLCSLVWKNWTVVRVTWLFMNHSKNGWSCVSPLPSLCLHPTLRGTMSTARISTGCLFNSMLGTAALW
jgi:hypothetical protein